MNKWIISGNLTRDPETQTTPGGSAVTHLSVAVNRKRASTTETIFVRVSAWGKTGENAAKYLRKGRGVIVSGPLRATAYIDRDGQARPSLEIDADDIEFIGGQRSGENREPAAAPAGTAAPAPVPETAYTAVTDEDIPF